MGFGSTNERQGEFSSTNQRLGEFGSTDDNTVISLTPSALPVETHPEELLAQKYTKEHSSSTSDENTNLIQPAQPTAVIQPTQLTAVIQPAQPTAVIQPAQPPAVIQPMGRAAVIFQRSNNVGLLLRSSSYVKVNVANGKTLYNYSSSRS